MRKKIAIGILIMNILGLVVGIYQWNGIFMINFLFWTLLFSNLVVRMHKDKEF